MLKLGSVMIGSTNAKALKEFYERVFGRPADWSEEGWSGWKFDSTFVTIGEHSQVQGRAKEPQRVIVNLETEDVKGEFQRIKGLGGQVVKDPYELEGSWIATLADPDGNYFQVMSPWKM
jgi:predicted enzyme related to lactoylglutathione lyase